MGSSYLSELLFQVPASSACFQGWQLGVDFCVKTRNIPAWERGCLHQRNISVLMHHKSAQSDFHYYILRLEGCVSKNSAKMCKDLGI